MNFFAKNKKISKVRKTEKNDDMGGFSRKKVFIILKAFFPKMGRRKIY